MPLPLIKRIRYRLEWALAVVGFAFFRLLPIGTASDIGGFIARKLGPHVKVSLRARENLIHAFPDWSNKQLDNTIEGIWDNLGRYVAEFPHVADMDEKTFRSHVEITGLEHLKAMQNHPGGTLLFAAHMGNWEFGLKVPQMQGFPFAIVYRPLNNPYMEKLVNSYRDRYCRGGIPKNFGGGREIIRRLKNGEPVAVLIDQRMATGIPLSFFGRTAMTSTSVADLALKYGYPVFPCRFERIGRQAKFRITYYPPLVVTSTGDHTEDSRRIMQTTHDMLTEWIREKPEQWFWVHKRWAL